MADIISGATFFAPADLGTGLTENGVLIAGQSFNGSYGGTVADLGTYPNVTVIVGSEITNPPLKHSIGSKQILGVKDTTISGGSFTFNGSGTGGGLFAISGALYMDNTTISDCTMDGKGSASNEARGMLYVAAGKTVTLNKVVFSGNSTACSGGLIWNYGKLTVSGSTFKNNINEGALIYSTNSVVNFYNTLFEKNFAGVAKVTQDENNEDVTTISINSDSGIFNMQSGAEINCIGCTFTGNTAQNGGVTHNTQNSKFYADGSYFYDNLATSNGGALLMRGKNDAITNCYFSGNTANSGGAVYLSSAYADTKDKKEIIDRDLTVTGCTFNGNTAAANGGAIYLSGGSRSYTVNIGGKSEFLTSTDTIYIKSSSVIPATLNLSGEITLNAKIYSNESGVVVNVADDTKFNFDNSADISLLGMTFAGGATMNFTGSKKVTFAKNQLLTGVNVTIDATDYMTAGTYTIAENAGGLDENNISLTQNTKAPYLKSEFGYSGTSLTLTVTDTSTQAALCDPSIEVGKSKVVKVDGIWYSGENYATIHEAMAAKTVAVMNGGNITDQLVVKSGKTVIFNDIVASGLSKTDGTDIGKSYGLVCYTPSNTTAKFFGGTFSNNLLLGYRAGNLYNNYGGHLIVDRTENGKGALFTQNVCAGIGAAIFSQGSSSVTSVASVTGATFSYNRSGGAAVYSNSAITITDSLFDHNLGLGQDGKYKDGASLGIYSGTANLSNVEFTGNTGNYGGAIYASGGTSILDGVNIHDNEGKSHGGGIHCRGNMTITNSQFEKNKGSNGGAFYLYHADSARTAEFSATTFTGNTGNNGGAIYVTTGMEVTVDGCIFDQNTVRSDGKGGAIYNSGTMTITNTEFKTATDTIFNSASGTMTFGGSITLNSDLGGSGTYIFDKGVSFTTLRDFSNVYIAVDGADWEEKDTVIATNISKIGGYGVLGNNGLMLSVNSNNELVLSKIQETVLVKDEADPDAAIVGSTENLITSGEAKNFIANKTTEAVNLLTSIEGGKISNALVGGAYAKATDDDFDGANIGNVELNFGVSADVAAKVYAGGYLYGDKNAASAAAKAQMNVGRVRVNLDGGAVSTNMYGGVHARDNGNAKVEMVDITVTAGNHGRIYAGGWAEKGAKSYVTTSNVTISGGVVDYLYGAGANADGHTYVGTTNITIENYAVVNTIFMGGRYGYSEVDKVNLTFAGAEKVLKRLSGVSSAGMDYSDATVVELETNVTADLIDYVDKFTINQGFKLTANNGFFLGSRDNKTGLTVADSFTTFDFVTDGLSNAWDAIAGIEDFTNAKFSINGTFGTWQGNVMAITSDEKKYTITKDETAGTITLAQVK